MVMCTILSLMSLPLLYLETIGTGCSHFQICLADDAKVATKVGQSERPRPQRGSRNATSNQLLWVQRGYIKSKKYCGGMTKLQ